MTGSMMGDACICIDYEGTYLDYDEVGVTDESDKKCSECHRTIPAGAPHVVHLVMEEEPEFDDEGEQLEADQWEESHRECLCCSSVRESLFECGWYIGMVWSMIRDHMDEMMPVEEDDDDGDESWLDPPTKPIGPNGW